MAERRVRAGLWRRLYPGVYAAGHAPLSRTAPWLAAVLACGPEAVLSHHAAAALWQLRGAPTGAIDVTAPGKRRHPGVRSHTSRSLSPADRTVIDAIPVTSLERTLLDLAPLVSDQRLRTLLEAAQRRDLVDLNRFRALESRSSGHRGLPKLKRALAALNDEAPWTQSQLERRFLELIRAAGLPEPQCNVIVAGVLVDFFWPEQRLVAEVDSYTFHKTRQSFEDDRREDLTLQLAGFRTARPTYRRIRHEPDRLIADLRGLLASRPAA
jgi:very-short-patch-repair endonuclease